MRIKRWDIWLAYVPFEENDGRYKPRPALVMSPIINAPYWLTFKMTSKPPRSHFPGEYRIRYWQEAGLDMPTTIRLSKVAWLHDSDFIRKFGQLHDYDIENVIELVEDIYQVPNESVSSVRDVIAGTITEALNQKTAGTDMPQPRPQSRCSAQRRNRRK